MSIREILANCYETNSDIHIDLKLSEQITLEDIFAIIFLISDTKCRLVLHDNIFNILSFGHIDNNTDHMYITKKINNPEIIVMLYFINRDNNRYCPKVSYESYIINYNNKEEFVRLATFTDMINYPKVRYLMTIFDIDYTVKSGMARLSILTYLDIIKNTKSARKN